MNHNSLWRLGTRRIRVHPKCFVAPTAVLIGEVELKRASSVWWGAVLRGDYDSIVVGEESNIQDNCVVHMDEGYPVSIGRHVTVGHKAVLHGCTIGDNCLVGINSVILNGVELGDGCIVGANALITENKKIPSGSLILGSPGKVVRQVTTEERQEIEDLGNLYLRNASLYRENCNFL